MKKIILITLAALFVFKTNAQPPMPDFTVTDSDGNEFQLYADYLDQGKTVVLDLFFTYCPPCIAIAPLMEPFYQEWGGGAYDVEFISLTIQANDTNEDVAAYLLEHGHTFLGVGADGGSLIAVSPFYSGDWGDFEGAPTFVVIAPDGSVNFDPSGSNYAATIDSVDQAIRLTGARKPYDFSGTIIKPNGQAISGVDLLINEEVYSPAVDVSGLFELNDVLLKPDSVYTVSAFKDGSFNVGLTTFDLIKIRKHILGIDTFDAPWKYLAADANKSSTVSTSDLIQLTKLVLAISQDLPDNDPWGFIKTDYTFIIPGPPFFETYNGNATTYQFTAGSNIPLDFSGYKIGDINESADPD
jgi:thiol-disulfide isomerase/thioredoxin